MQKLDLENLYLGRFTWDCAFRDTSGLNDLATFGNPVWRKPLLWRRTPKLLLLAKMIYTLKYKYQLLLQQKNVVTYTLFFSGQHLCVYMHTYILLDYF